MGSSIYPFPALAEYLLPYAQLVRGCPRAGSLPRKLFCLLCSQTGADTCVETVVNFSSVSP